MATGPTVQPKPSASMKFVLDHPVEFNGSAITSVTVRRPKGRDMRFLPKGETSLEALLPFYAQLCSVAAAGGALDEAILDEMDASDINRLGEIIGGFLSPKKART